MSSTAPLLDCEPTALTFRRDVYQGLAGDRKSLPCKYLYDHRGSQLFDAICELEEYYPTRTELSILRDNVGEIVATLPDDSVLVEPGSGSSLKTRLVLDAAKQLAAYVPVDISREHLRQSAEQLAAHYTELAILPVCADFTQPFDLPDAIDDDQTSTVYFPGSTIGNFHPDEAVELLSTWNRLSNHAALLIGFDLRKETATLEAAYDDAAGVTAKFSLNLLVRINRELDGDFRIEHFRHRARYNAEAGRIEIDIVSQRAQQVLIGERTFDFAEGEPIRTEYSYKYTIDGFAELAAEASWQLDRSWTDAQNRFAVVHFLPTE